MSATNQVVFKQWYKPRNLASTKALNQKHLLYIATRPGAMPNPGCDFSLWGQIAGMDKIGNINLLHHAHRLIGQASERHTIYRAVLSVSRETALKYGLHERAEWERLLRSRISVIRKEMNISKENFRWMAAMHYQKNHPHVHILYWDASKEPKQEFVNAERFNELSENVRSIFTSAITQQLEINSIHDEMDAATKQTRLELAALLKAANLPDALDLNHIKTPQLDDLGRELMELALELPTHGRLKYQFLPPEYKEKLNTYLEHVLQISDFAKLQQQYESLGIQLNQMYGTTPKLSEEYRAQAHSDFLKALGNETLRFLKETTATLQSQTPPEDIQQLITLTRSAAQSILQNSEEYKCLLSRLPKHRTPLSALCGDEEFKTRLDALTRHLTDDLRIRSKAKALIDHASEPESTRTENKQTSKEVYKALYSTMRAEIWEQLQKDSGYDVQRGAALTTQCLLQIFRGTSQSKNHLKSQHTLRREKYRNLSKDAKQDLRRKREQEGSWEAEW